MTDMHSVHGMCCPDCGQAVDFTVKVTETYHIDGRGMGIKMPLEFNPDNPCICNGPHCGTWQTVGYFKAKAEQEPNDDLAGTEGCPDEPKGTEAQREAMREGRRAFGQAGRGAKCPYAQHGEETLWHWWHGGYFSGMNAAIKGEPT